MTITRTNFTRRRHSIVRRVRMQNRRSVYNLPMRIGIDCRLPAYRMGGISQYIIRLLNGLADLDRENDYFVFHSFRDDETRIPTNCPNFRRITAYTPPHHRLERWAFGLECLPYRLDVLHSPDFIPPAIGARKKVITIHDLTFHFFPQYQTSEARRYYQDQIARAVREADHILADSENTRQDVIRLMGASPGRITTAHLAANPLYARSVLPEVVDQMLAAYGLERGYILHVGTLEPRKNIPTLLHALKGLEAAGVAPVQLVLVGATGWLYQEIFQLVEGLGLENRVRHLEGVPDEKLHHLYHGASLLAQPSFYEGFGLPPLEAMLCGCPVVSSNGGSLSEIVGHGGILLEPDNVEAWQGAIFNLLTDAHLRQRLVEAGKRQAKKFGWRQMVETTLDVYRKVGLQ